MLLGAAIAVTGSVALAGATATSCQADLTCARKARTVVISEFSRGPNLANWSRIAHARKAGVVSTADNPVPKRMRDDVTGMELVVIPGACYRTDAWKGQSREVCVAPYYIGAYEVTFEEYDRFARATNRKLPEDEDWGRGRRPVINVSVYDALNFAKWLTGKTGAHYRLPTEVEWEHAARAGSTSAYPWGENLGRNQANCDGCGSRWDDEKTAPVGSFQPNAWGLYDVVGNVGEWTCSMRDPDPAHSFERCDSIYETRRRAYRNGGWSDDAERLTSAFRDWNVAMRRTDDVGFRLVRECRQCKTGLAQPRERKVAQQRSEITESQMNLWNMRANAAGSLLIAFTGSAVADQGAHLYKANLCHTCHGEDGTHPVTQDYPVIAGQPVKYLVRQMKDIRDGRRNNGLSASMRAVVSKMTDEDFEKIAEWLASRW